jgi:ABC-type phosphate transport system auxiliary subunit
MFSIGQSPDGNLRPYYHPPDGREVGVHGHEELKQQTQRRNALRKQVSAMQCRNWPNLSNANLEDLAFKDPSMQVSDGLDRGWATFGNIAIL